MKRIALTIAAILFLLFAPGNFAGALTFHANLNSIKVTALPGEVVNQHFALSLPTTEQRTQFKIHTQDFYRSEDGKQSFYKAPGTLAHSCANWITINPVETAVDPGGTLDTKLTITVPGDVKPGGYWCVLTLDEEQDPLRTAPQGVGMQFLTSISVGVFVTILPIDKTARIMSVQIAGNQASVKLADTGDCPLAADGRVDFFKPGDKNPLATTKIARAALFCEPINTTLLTADLPDQTVLPSGHYLVRVVIDIGLDHYIGAQKEMDVTRGSDSKSPATGTAP